MRSASVLQIFSTIRNTLKGSFFMSELSIRQLQLVECPKCQKRPLLVLLKKRESIALHYCKPCDYTFVTDYRINHAQLAKNLIRRGNIR
jgi:ribosomal protein L37AE/L43A